MSKQIASDHPLNEQQQQTLTAFLDTVIPPQENRLGGGGIDLIAWLVSQKSELITPLALVLDGFGDSFVSWSVDEQVEAVKLLSEKQPDLFQGLVFGIYACYYQDDRVMAGIGLAAGPPFPRGNTLETGDLSLLDPVLGLSKSYRRV